MNKYTSGSASSAWSRDKHTGTAKFRSLTVYTWTLLVGSLNHDSCITRDRDRDRERGHDRGPRVLERHAQGREQSLNAHTLQPLITEAFTAG